MKSSISIVDVDRLETWTRYRAGLCESCAANCCTMPLEVRLSDLVRLGLVNAFEAEHEEPGRIAKRLQKARLIEHFNHKHAIFTIARRAGGDCHFLDAAREGGMTLREAVKPLARHLGVQASQIYRLAAERDA